MEESLFGNSGVLEHGGCHPTCPLQWAGQLVGLCTVCPHGASRLAGLVLGERPAYHGLEILILNKRTWHFHFALGPAKSVAGPAGSRFCCCWECEACIPPHQAWGLSAGLAAGSNSLQRLWGWHVWQLHMGAAQLSKARQGFLE